MTAMRSLVFVIWMYGLMAVMGLIWLPSLLMPRAAIRFGIRTYVRLLKWGLRWICGVHTEIRGLENLPDGAALIAAKHQCMWDVFIPFLVMDDPAIIMKRELLWYPVLGWYALKSDQVPIDRGGAARTLKKMIAAAKARIAQGRQIVIYPEGTRRAPGAPPDYKPAGVTAFYRQLDAPCVPAANNFGLCWPRRGFIRRPGRIVYEILPPVPSGLDRKAMMTELECAIESASDRLLDEGLAAQDRARSDLETAA